MEYIENDDCEIVYSIRDLAIDVIKTLVRREVSLLFVRNKRLQPFMQMLVCEMADVDFEKIEYNELTCQDLASIG